MTHTQHMLQLPVTSMMYDAISDVLYLFHMDCSGFVQCVAAVTPEPAELAVAPVEFVGEV